MFLILTRIKNEEGGADVLLEVEELRNVVSALDLFREDYPDAFLAEVLTHGHDPSTAIPGELDRAIDAWNAMAKRINVHVDKVAERSRFVAPYRKWKKAAGKRDYFLEHLIADVEAQPYLWPTIRFGWLLRSTRTKDGELNSEKVHARAFGKTGNGKSEQDYLGLARRVGAWQRDHDHLYTHGDGGDGDRSYERAFAEGTGVTRQKWEQIRKQFNGNGAGV